MVTPSWESFSKPIQENKRQVENFQEKEFEQEIPGKLKDEKKPEGKKPQWGEFKNPMTYQGEEDQKSDEDTFGYLARQISMATSRIGEQVAGRYGNIEKFSKEALTNFPKAGGIFGWALSELIGPDKWERMVKGPVGQQQILPTSEQFKKGSELLSAGYTSPKTKGEKRFQEFTEDVGATLTGKPNFVNNLLIPAAANVAKNIAEDAGFGEKRAALAKLAIWTPLTLAYNINAGRYASDLMNIGRNGFGPNVTANTQRYQTNLNRVNRNILKGDPRSALAQQQLTGIESDIANGQTTMRDLMNRYDAINAAKRDKGLFSLSPGDRKAAIKNINEVRDVVRSEIQNLGQQYNPEALKSWENGVQAWATIHTSNAVSNWVESIAKGPYAKILTVPAAGLFGIGSYGTMHLPKFMSLGASGAIPASYKTGQVLYRMWNDKNLSNYYWNAFNAAQNQNLPAFLNNYNKINKKLEESMPTTPKSEPEKK